MIKSQKDKFQNKLKTTIEKLKCVLKQIKML